MAKAKKAAIKKEPITVKEYCELAGVKAPTVSYRVQNKDILPGILYYQYNVETRQYELYRDERIQDEEIPMYFRKKPITVNA